MSHDIQSHLQGHGVTLVTPFSREGDVDFPALERLINRSIDEGVDFLSVLGPGSEAALLDTDETVRILDFVSEINAGRKPLLAGIASTDTRSAVKAASEMKVRDVLALFCAAPSPIASSDMGFVGHFRSIAQAASFPVIMHHPGGDHRISVSSDALLQLSQEPNIAGIVECSGDVALFGELVRNRPAGFAVLCGRDVMALPLLALGADGALSSIGNAFSRSFGRMVHQMRFGSIHDARETHHLLAPMMRILEKEGRPTGIKTILSHLNLCESAVRLPNTPVSDITRDALYRTIAELPSEVIGLGQIA